MTRFTQPALIALLALTCLAPFADKAVHIDDPVYIWVARHILQSPLDFFGFTANWHGQVELMHLINKNPPLVSYYLAAAGALFGWSEVALHLAFLPLTIALLLGTYTLARQLETPALMAALVTLATPAVLVSGTTLMSDTMMLAFYVWAVVCWRRGLDDASARYLFAAGLLIAASTLSKYFGLTLIPLLFVFTVARQRRFGVELLWLIPPSLLLAGYQWLTWRMYGHGLIGSAVEYALRDAGGTWLAASKTVTALAFTGGALASVAFFAPWLWSRRRALPLAALVFLGLLLSCLGLHAADALPLGGETGVQWGLVAQLVLMGAAGCHLLALTAADVWTRRDADALLLAIWVCGTFVFAAYVNWTVSVRAVLPMAPAVGILLARRLADRAGRPQSGSAAAHFAPLVPALALALVLAWADHALAGNQRTAAEVLFRQYRPATGTLWYQGHWGWQYYLDRLGASAMTRSERNLRSGDLVLIPGNGSNVWRPPNSRLVQVHAFPGVGWVATMREPPFRAGWYSDAAGPLPFRFGAPGPEEFGVYVIEHSPGDGSAPTR